MELLTLVKILIGLAIFACGYLTMTIISNVRRRRDSQPTTLDQKRASWRK